MNLLYKYIAKIERLLLIKAFICFDILILSYDSYNYKKRLTAFE